MGQFPRKARNEGGGQLNRSELGDLQRHRVWKADHIAGLQPVNVFLLIVDLNIGIESPDYNAGWSPQDRAAERL